MHYFAAEKWEHHPFYGPIMKRANAVFIKRGEVDRRALKLALDMLERGEVFGIAPEGTRSRSGGLNKAKDGAAYLASRANVPIVPCAVIDADLLGRNARRLRRTKLKVVFGEPFCLPDLGRRTRMADMAAYSHLIMVKLADLLPERYHGYYADSPALAALKRGEDPFPHCLQAEGVAP
jgi:1-acyl-sn-glycerol-3-phosphate acyltransferase